MVGKLKKLFRRRLAIELGSETGIEEELSSKERYVIAKKTKIEKELKFPIIGIKIIWRF